MRTIIIWLSAVWIFWGLTGIENAVKENTRAIKQCAAHGKENT